MTQTISRDLDDINAKVKEASYNLRAERVRLIKLKVKEVLGKDVDVKIGEFNTDAVVNLNLNDLAKTEGIVRILTGVSTSSGPKKISNSYRFSKNSPNFLLDCKQSFTIFFRILRFEATCHVGTPPEHFIMFENNSKV